MTTDTDSAVPPGPNKERLALWYGALLSGRYVQGQSCLCAIRPDGDLWCCLGVACDVAVKHGLEIGVKDVDLSRSFDCESAYLPQSVAHWYGLETNDPNLCGVRAAAWNDSFHLSFPGIAALIKHEFGLYA